MRKIKEVLRLKFELGFANRQIARSCRVSHSTVADYLQRAEAAGLNSWPLPVNLDETELEARLFPPGETATPSRSVPNWPAIHEDLHGHKHVTLQLVWQEYKQDEPGGYQYSRFCELYRHWTGKLDLVLRQEHRAGEKLFVDYAGQTVPITDPKTGMVTEASIFVAVLGASNYTFSEASWKQDLACWIGSHIRALEFLGACPALLIPDNFRTPDIPSESLGNSRHWGDMVRTKTCPLFSFSRTCARLNPTEPTLPSDIHYCPTFPNQQTSVTD